MSLRERLFANLKERAVSQTAAHAEREAVLKPLRTELRKMEMLHANPEIEARAMAKKAEQKIAQDVAYTDYIEKHPDVAAAVIESELLRASRKMDRVEARIAKAAKVGEAEARAAGVTDDSDIASRGLVAAMQAANQLKVNTGAMGSATLRDLTSRMGGVEADAAALAEYQSMIAQGLPSASPGPRLTRRARAAADEPLTAAFPTDVSPRRAAKGAARDARADVAAALAAAAAAPATPAVARAAAPAPAPLTPAQEGYQTLMKARFSRK